MLTLKSLLPTGSEVTQNERIESIAYGYIFEALNVYSDCSETTGSFTLDLHTSVKAVCTRFYESNYLSLEDAVKFNSLGKWENIGKQLFRVREHGVAAMDMPLKRLFNLDLCSSAIALGQHKIFQNYDGDVDCE